MDLRLEIVEEPPQHRRLIVGRDDDAQPPPVGGRRRRHRVAPSPQGHDEVIGDHSEQKRFGGQGENP